MAFIWEDTHMIWRKTDAIHNMIRLWTYEINTLLSVANVSHATFENILFKLSKTLEIFDIFQHMKC